MSTEVTAPAPSNFIRTIIDADISSDKHQGVVATRFPPEPNGYLHIGHAKSICLNFGIARDYKGTCNLRFDDTNPTKEDVEYVDSIINDVKWLGFDCSDRILFASDYFQQLYDFALELVRNGRAFVCDLNAEQIREHRGTLTEPGTESPFRNRTIEENLNLFTKMKAGEFPDGSKTLRAKIDMANPNLNMRDPVMYRILHASHHRTGDAWCIYPMYDWAHGIEDAIEGITHSICTLEFEDHRPLYDWFLNNISAPCHPQQIEFARLALTRTLMSKRKLLKLVQEEIVDGWDDPRMPTLAGFRRRGYTPDSIQDFCDRIGVAKRNSTVDINLLEHCLREDLNKKARRAMAVLNPVKVIIENYPEDLVEWFEADNNPENPEAGKRMIPFCREIYIEADDFMENPPRKYHRLSPGVEVRLKHAYYVTCTGVKKDENGAIQEIICTYDPESKGGWSKDERKVKGTSHWVSARHAGNVQIRLYDHLLNDFSSSEEYENLGLAEQLNPDSLIILENCKVEPELMNADPGELFQFLRVGYFAVDSKYTIKGQPVFNRSVSLKDSWSKMAKKG
ncbi:MAG: glutamine--tRNA ligase [Candidatus Wallbacteria bacterium HGW-Wallbacteria-1]|jgi:glutaminyl-tRNA synthetase|uniref:Glutamine--tRNA ligase n=1 Tax=Candidatus Wallbacteria bacterium HGW-Wallbacteria-1 TaxID=2013854 RepID=A0A2N1PRD7_9BACT|nr:MAG: glutamine--tRNA ligase [Candidatus Wallbacteria bacterium HGW-Wallbacteria-1]